MTDNSDLDQNFARAKAQMATGREGIAAALEQFQALLPQVTNARGRGALNQQIWNAERALGRG